MVHLLYSNVAYLLFGGAPIVFGASIRNYPIYKANAFRVSLSTFVWGRFVFSCGRLSEDGSICVWKCMFEYFYMMSEKYNMVGKLYRET